MSMTRFLVALLLFLLAVPLPAQDKSSLYKSIDSRGDSTWDAAMKIWNWAEPGYQETKSSALLSGMLEQAGFDIRRGVAEIPTAFTATFGAGQPVIGILGEFDALPGLSQQAVPTRAPREGVHYGHGCGHHLFGAASMSAAIAIAEQIKSGRLKGTVRFYGCPAEEGGSGKVFMVQAACSATVTRCCTGIRAVPMRPVTVRRWPGWPSSSVFMARPPMPLGPPSRDAVPWTRWN